MMLKVLNLKIGYFQSYNGVDNFNYSRVSEGVLTHLLNNKIISFEIIVIALLSTFYELERNFYKHICEQLHFLPRVILVAKAFIEYTSYS